MKPNIFATVCLVTLLIGCRSSGKGDLDIYRCPNPTGKSGEQIVDEFIHYGEKAEDLVGEDMLKDPLILGGDLAVPMLLKRLEDKEFPKRRYAIGFLGNGRFKEALPLLEKILHDNLEEDYFSMDALESIWLIDPELGKKLAGGVRNYPGILGVTARGIESGQWPQFRRTCDEAKMHRHT